MLMETNKIPGAYSVDQTSLPKLVVSVATAIPAFIGYTEKATDGNVSLLNKPFCITSISEFRAFFGGAPVPQFDLAKATAGEATNLDCKEKQVLLKQTSVPFTLYYQILLFYSNGGGPCYIVSIGDYKAKEISADALKAGFDTLLLEQEPTMLLCPEAVKIKDKELCYSVQKAMLSHCGEKMRNRIAILDIFDGYKNRKDPSCDVIDEFREKIGSSFLSFGAAYYPWLNTSIVEDIDLNSLKFNAQQLKTLLGEELEKYPAAQQLLMQKHIDKLGTELDMAEQNMLNAILCQNSPIFRIVLAEAKCLLNLLAPSAAMAGIYARVDNLRGVWKAPANVFVQSVHSLTVDITDREQEELTAPSSGKSVNVIRAFKGDGIRVWGARTLEGNSQDWRFINVRRTMIMLEESAKNAVRAYAFEPNEAATWAFIKKTLQDFLCDIWRRGGLVGETPDDVFIVHVGLGETMSAEDVLNGILRVRIFVAPVHPAEFMEITFQQQMQKDL